MLGKLLKYDLKYMIKNMSAFYILAIVFAILTRICFSLKQTLIVNLIGQISVGAMFSMVISILINTLMRSFVRFNDSLYKDESYLTHTLPVTKKQLYESRFLQALIFTIVGFVFMVLSLFIAYYTPERMLMLKNTFNSLATGLGLNVTFMIIVIIFLFFVEIINILQCGFLGLIIGNKKEKSKIGLSVLFGFITYTITQSAVVIILFVSGLFNKSIMSIFTSNIKVDSTTIKLFSIIGLLSYIFIILIVNIICVKKLEKGVDVE